jgi:hypothetical protein
MMGLYQAAPAAKKAPAKTGKQKKAQKRTRR